MILNGNERGNGAELAQHLMNARDNEHVTIHDVQGFMSDDLFGAFAEAEAMSCATQCQKYLFSLSLNPPESADVSVAAFEAAIQKIENQLGLSGQPRAIVFHEKKGRRHAHCVWARIDGQKLKAINLSHYKRRLRTISMELYIEHGWEMPDGLKNHQDRDPLSYSLVEAQQANRQKRDPKTLKAMFKACWERSDSRASFAAALWSEGYALARGDRRGFVAVDSNGEIYSLSRWCGVKTKELRARLGDSSELLSIEEAHTQFEGLSHKPVTDSDTDFQKQLDALVTRQRAERDTLITKQQARHVNEIKARQAELPKGIQLAWSRISGQYTRLIAAIETEVTQAEQRDRSERQALIEKHLSERRQLERQCRELDLSASLEVAYAKALRNDPRQSLIIKPDNTGLNAKNLQRDPSLILDHMSKTQSRFSESDVKRALASYITDPGILRVAIDRALSSQKLVSLPTGDFTTRDYQNAELTLSGLSKSMNDTGRHGINPHHLSRAIKAQNKIMKQDFGGELSQEQIAALQHITSNKQLTCVVGLAGAGKSTMLDVANKAWVKQGLTVHGAALSGKAADGLQTSSNIKSRTLASLELSWKNGYELIKRGDVLVIDEAGMIGTRQLNRITDKINQIGAKLILVGDPDQLQPIEAGTPFRKIVETIGASRLTEIHRQKSEWQKLASKNLAVGRLQQALSAYEHHGSVRTADNQKQALASLIEDYMVDVELNTDATRLAFAHRRKDVFALNQAIRGALRLSGRLQDETLFQTDTGSRAFAVGDRLVFTQNDRTMGVKNGMLGTVQAIKGGKVVVIPDGQDSHVTIDTKHYNSFDHGYAVTIHKSQGATVDHAYVLGSRALDASLTYVAMTRHRDYLKLYINEKDRPKWIKTPSVHPQLSKVRWRLKR